MHAVQIGVTGSSGAGSAAPPVMGWMKQASSAQESTGWSWAKAIGADASQSAGTQAKASTTDKTLDKSEAAQAEPAANDATASKRPDLSALKLAMIVEKKPGAAAGDKTSKTDESSKHKTVAAQDETATVAKPAQESVDAAASIEISVAPVQVAAAPDATKAGADDKGKEKTNAVAAKRASTASSKGSDDTSKPGVTDAKAATSSVDATQKTASAEEAKPKVAEAFALAPQAAAHSNNNVETSGAIGLSGEASAAVHKPAANTAMQLPAEPKSVAAGAGATEINTAHTISAGPGQLEVGVLDGTHGWLSIRTEMSSNGTVNALLTSGPTAHESLRDSIPAMSGYLAAEQLNVDKIAVGSVAEDSFAGNNLAQSGQGSNGQQDRAETGAASSARTKPDETLQLATGISAALFGGASPVFRGDGIGSWLSVTA